MDFKKTNVIISEKGRPFWQTVLAALFFTVTLAQLAYALWEVFLGGGFWKAMSLLDTIILTGGLGLKFSIVASIHFDIAKRQYKKQYTIGSIKYGKWEYLPNIEYISVFKQGLSDSEGNRVDVIYDVNVWHNTSKHFTIYSCGELEPAFEMAKYMALKLDVDFLDATVPNDSRWVELYKDVAGEQ
jgi:hypothetical protein